MPLEWKPVGDAQAQSGSFRDTRGLKDATVYCYRVVGVGRTAWTASPSDGVSEYRIERTRRSGFQPLENKEKRLPAA